MSSGSSSSFEEKKATIKRMLEDAFADVAYPGDNNLAEDWAYDEKEDINDGFRGRHWKHMPEDVRNPLLGRSLACMTPRAFQFFLPGYIFVFLDFDDSECDQPTIYNLDPPGHDPEDDRFYEKWRVRFDERMRLLTLPQKKAIFAFLTFIKEEHWYEGDDLDRALAYFTRETQPPGGQESP